MLPLTGSHRIPPDPTGSHRIPPGPTVGGNLGPPRLLPTGPFWEFLVDRRQHCRDGGPSKQCDRTRTEAATRHPTVRRRDLQISGSEHGILSWDPAGSRSADLFSGISAVNSAAVNSTAESSSGVNSSGVNSTAASSSGVNSSGVNSTAASSSGVNSSGVNSRLLRALLM